MTVDRGVGDYKTRATVSGFRDDGGGQGVCGYVDDVVSCFEEEGKLDPGPALCQGGPAELCHVGVCAAFNKAVVRCHKPGCTLLYPFQGVNLVFTVGVPD